MTGEGIDYQNPVFRRPDGSSRILAVWDQTIQEGEPPENFNYGTEYTNEDINRALASGNPLETVPSRDTNGHGTAMASIAAGSSLGGGAVFRGAAYDADIVMVKLKECKPYLREYYLLPENVIAYQATDVIMAVEYLNSFALSFYRPVVICLGIGSSFGSHNGNSLVSRYLSRIADKRSRIVVIGGGNEGNTAHHYSGTLNPVTVSSIPGITVPAPGAANPATSQNTGQTEEIEIRVGEGERGFLAEIWGKAPNVFTLGIRSPGGETVPNTGLLEDTGREYKFVYEDTEITVNYALVEGATGDQVILLRFENPTPGIWTLLLRNDSGLPEAGFHIWLPISIFLSGETYFLQPDPNTTMTLPSYASQAISISTYDDGNNSIYVRSGRGFSKEGSGPGNLGMGGIIKPDVAAPGVFVSAALPSIGGLPTGIGRPSASEAPGISFQPASGMSPAASGEGESVVAFPPLRIGTVAGSSASVALAAGGIAQFMQWAMTDRNANYIRSVDVKNYLIRGAVRDPGLVYPNRLWGFGKLNIQGIFDNLARV